MHLADKLGPSIDYLRQQGKSWDDIIDSAIRTGGKDLEFKIIIMLLRNFDFALKYFDYKSKTELEDTSSPTINGWYKFINGVFSALFVIDNKLYYLYGEDIFLITESSRVLLKDVSEFEIDFQLFKGNDLLVKFLYSIPDTELIVSPFEYISKGDFNWGDFIAKIINDKKRKRNFILNTMENIYGKE